MQVHVSLGACALILLFLAGCAPPPAPEVAAPPVVYTGPHKEIDERVAHYAQVYDVPETLIHRSIQRDWGLMQIRYDTARGMGYRGPPRGLLDADANLKYAVAYLANAYVVGGRDENRAIALYAGGYFYEARRKHMQDRLRTAENAEVPAADP
jgi:hypothetical protein